MGAQIHSLLIIVVSMLANSSPVHSHETGEITYGSAEIIRIHQITSDFTLICDIRNFPPIVGQKIPVRVRGLESLESYPNSDLLDFLKTLFKQNQNDPNHPVLLQNIERGQTFCLVADIEIDGIDLGDRMVREGLVKRILKVPTANLETVTSSTPADALPAVSPPRLNPVPPTAPKPRGYVASKSSKIFHRPDCPHTKRITEAQKVYFPTRDRAIATGRRPCKTCNP